MHHDQAHLAPILLLSRTSEANLSLPPGFSNGNRSLRLGGRLFQRNAHNDQGKPHPLELRSRVVAFVEEGHSHREAPRQFRVSPQFANNLILLKAEIGSLAARRQGHGEGCGKLAGHAALALRRIEENSDLTLDELYAEFAGRGIKERSQLQCRTPAAPTRPQPPKKAYKRAGSTSLTSETHATIG